MKHLYYLKIPLLCIGIWFFSPLFISAQSLVYEYDNAGNRISRKVINMPAKSSAKAEVKPDSIIEVLSNVEVLAYPNPAKETLNVEAKGLKEDEKVQIFLFNSQGALVYKKESDVSFNPIDMSAYLAGVYILRIIAGEKKTEIKIIKQ